MAAKKMNVRHYFKLNLDLEGRKCLVVGGDGEALEKLLRLFECGADITLVSPRTHPSLQSIVRAGYVRHLRRCYKPGDERGMYFVINCVKTDGRMSKKLFNACTRRKILISSYDQPQFSTATMAALVRAGRMRISISSDGASPALARRLRMEFERMLDRKFMKFTDWVSAYRARMVAEGVTPDERRKRLRELLKDFRLDVTCRYPEQFEKKRGHT